MTAQVTLLIGVAVFALCVAIPELVHLWDRGVGLGEKTISHYLRGQNSKQNLRENPCPSKRI